MSTTTAIYDCLDSKQDEEEDDDDEVPTMDSVKIETFADFEQSMIRHTSTTNTTSTSSSNNNNNHNNNNDYYYDKYQKSYHGRLKKLICTECDRWREITTMYERLFTVDINRLDMYNKITFRLFLFLELEYRQRNRHVQGNKITPAMEKSNIKYYGWIDDDEVNFSFSVKRDLLSLPYNWESRYSAHIVEPNKYFKYGCVYKLLMPDSNKGRKMYHTDYFICIFENGMYFCWVKSEEDLKELDDLKDAIMHEVMSSDVTDLFVSLPSE